MLRSIMCLAFTLALAAQDKPKKPGTKEGAKPRAEAGTKDDGKKDDSKKDDSKKAPKDDATTAKDLVIVALDKFSKSKVNSKRADWRTTLPEPPKQVFDAGRDYFWHLQTNVGLLCARLRADVAPMHATSTIYLTRAGFYDGLVFHRAIKEFMAQGGCPLGNGNGNPGYKMDSECNEVVKHDKAGILSAANEGKPKTEGSQFFITYAPTAHLDGKHTVFGEIVEGIDVLKTFEARSGTNEDDKPTDKLVIERAWVSVVVRDKGK